MYTLEEWRNLPQQQKHWAVEGLAKSRNIKLGTRVTLDHRLIGTDMKEAVVVKIRPNTSWDPAEDPSGEANYPNLLRNMVIVVESKDGRTIDVQLNEISKVHNR